MRASTECRVDELIALARKRWLATAPDSAAAVKQLFDVVVRTREGLAGHTLEMRVSVALMLLESQLEMLADQVDREKRN